MDLCIACGKDCQVTEFDPKIGIALTAGPFALSKFIGLQSRELKRTNTKGTVSSYV